MLARLALLASVASVAVADFTINYPSANTGTYWIQNVSSVFFLFDL